MAMAMAAHACLALLAELPSPPKRTLPNTFNADSRATFFQLARRHADEKVGIFTLCCIGMQAAVAMDDTAVSTAAATTATGERDAQLSRTQ